MRTRRRIASRAKPSWARLMRLGFDIDAQALFARFSTPADETRKALINDLIVALKNAGVWSKLDALYLMAAHDAQAARQNWVQDGYNLTAVASPTFTADRGYAGNGSSSYLRTNFVPSSAGGKYTLDSAHYGVWSRTNSVANNSCDMGARNNTTVNQNLLLSRRTSNGMVFRINQNLDGSSTSNADSSGHLIVTRSAAGAYKVARNGAAIASGTASSSALVSVDFFIGMGNGAGSPAMPSAREYAAASIGENLTEADLVAFHAALNTYLTAVGAA